MFLSTCCLRCSNVSYVTRFVNHAGCSLLCVRLRVGRGAELLNTGARSTGSSCSMAGLFSLTISCMTSRFFFILVVYGTSLLNTNTSGDLNI